MPDEFEKVLNSWKHVIGHDDGKLSKEMRELILQTVVLLEELKVRRAGDFEKTSRTGP